MTAGAQFFNGLFFDAGDIGAGDAMLLGDFPLGQRFAAVQAVTQDEDFPFAAVELGDQVLPTWENWSLRSTCSMA